MSVRIAGRRRVVHIALLVTVIAGLLFAAGLLDGALAQASPFGAPRPQAPVPPVGGVVGWIFAKQAEFYRQFSSLLRAAKTDAAPPGPCSDCRSSTAFFTPPVPATARR